jgi:hypothetical protein
VCWNRDPLPVYISPIMAAKPTLYGRELSDAELEAIRAQVESFDTIEHIDDGMRDLIAAQWPHLLAKLPPRLRPRRKPGTRRRPG